MSDKFRQKTVEFTSTSGGGLGVPRRLTQQYSLEAQGITSSGHDFRSLGRSSGDIGGFFSSSKMTCGSLPQQVTLYGGYAPTYDAYTSTGVIVPPELEQTLRTSYGDFGSRDAIQYIGPNRTTKQHALSKGTTAIARVAPASPVWDGATAIAELVGGVPSLPGKGGTFSGEYLNAQFAVLPTVSDLESLANAAQKSEEILAQLERDSGKLIRRSYAFEPESMGPRTVWYDKWNSLPVMLGGVIPTAFETPAYGHSTCYSEFSRDFRFSGAFTYHLPPKGTWRRKIAELDALYGVVPGVDTAWNALPFSWLADWHGNMGDVLQNMSNFASDGLVMQYGYITCVDRKSTTYEWDYPVYLAPGVSSSVSGKVTLEQTEMTRYAANPFGFGVSVPDYTLRQASILAALGFSLR